MKMVAAVPRNLCARIPDTVSEIVDYPWPPWALPLAQRA